MILKDCSKKFYCPDLYITDMIPNIDVAQMVSSFPKESWTSKRIKDSSVEKYL